MVQGIDDHNDHDNDDTINLVESDEEAVPTGNNPAGTSGGASVGAAVGTSVGGSHRDVNHPAGGFPCAAEPCSRADVPPVVVCTVDCTVASAASVGTSVGNLTGAEDTKSVINEPPSGLMTASATKSSRPSREIHCATDADLCLPPNCWSHRLTRRCCRDGDKARGSAQSQGEQRSRPRILNQISADEHPRGHPHCIVTDEHPSGHPCFLPFRRVWRSRSRGGACFHTTWTHRLSTHTNMSTEHLRTCRCMRNACAHNDVHSLRVFPLTPSGLKVR